jgi:ABC-type enterochelin transport system permease subunit
MADSFAVLQLARVEALLAKCVGMNSITVGNTAVSYQDLIKQRDYWRREVARESGRFPRVLRMKMGGSS